MKIGWQVWGWGWLVLAGVGCDSSGPVEARVERQTLELASFDAPASWTRTANDSGIQFTLQEPAARSACAISVYKSTAGTDPKQSFTSDWESIVKPTTNPSTAPEMVPAITLPGWTGHRGQAPYVNESGNGVVTLVTYTGFGTSVAFVIATNNPARYEKTVDAFLASVQLAQPGVQTASTPVRATGTAASLAGTWGRGSSVTSPGGSFGRYRYTKQQYTFNGNGTYAFLRKNYVEDDKETFLTRESGTYSVSGDSITIAPATNVIEAWSKKNGGDNYNQLLTTQKLPLEKVTYRWVIAALPEIKESNLVLLSERETVRDGAYNATLAFPNGWRYSPTTLANPSYSAIKLPAD